MTGDSYFGVDKNGCQQVVINSVKQDCSHLIPLINEKKEFINVIGVYSKNGWITRAEEEFINQYSDRIQFVFMTASGPYYERHYKRLYRKYDGVMGLDTCQRVPSWKYNNNLELNYSMMARSGPEIDGFYYENCLEKADMDFSILTWYNDRKAKVWKDAYRTIVGLCSEGYRGILINQRGDNTNILRDRRIARFVEEGKLEIYGTLGIKEFHHLSCRAKVGIFPNRSDAFPKHIIECLLQNKPIVISKELLFGVKTLEKLGDEVVLSLDFRNKSYLNKIASFMDQISAKRESDVRSMWTTRYDYNRLTSIWASELYKTVGCAEHEKVMCLRHLPRFCHETKMVII